MEFSKFTVLCVFLWCCAISASAQQAHINQNTEWFTRFSKCDEDFFRAVKEQAPAFSLVASLDETEEFAWFKVPDRNTEKKTRALFNPLVHNPIDSPDKEGKLRWATQIDAMPVIQVGKLELSGYHDDASSPDFGVLWGFQASGTFQEVVAALQPLIPDWGDFNKNDALKVYSRTELWNGSEWVQEKNFPHSDYRIGAIERSLNITESAPKKIMIMCSISNFLERKKDSEKEIEAIIKKLRPDMQVGETVRRAWPKEFSEVPVLDKVIASVREVTNQTATDWWRPKFKRLRFVEVQMLTDSPFSSTVDLTVDGDKVQLRITNSKAIKTDLYMVAGLFPLKAEMLLPDNVKEAYQAELEKYSRTKVMFMGPASFVRRAIVTKPIDILLPDAIKPGEKISFSYEMTWFDMQLVTMATNCEVGERFSAAIIHPGLKGDALDLMCYIHHIPQPQVFFEDLNIFLPFNRHHPDLRITDLEFER